VQPPGPEKFQGQQQQAGESEQRLFDPLPSAGWLSFSRPFLAHFITTIYNYPGRHRPGGFWARR